MKYFIILFFICSINLFSQSTDEPIYNKEIYFFIDNQSSKGNIEIFDAIRPYTRLTIAEKLLELSNGNAFLTNTEKEQLDFYKKEYAFEIKFILKDTTTINEFFQFGVSNRFKVFKYYDNNFTFDFDPVVGLEYDFAKKNYHQYGGIKFKGRISNFLGFYFDYRDNLERGDNLDFRKRFSPETGVIISKSGTNKIEYSETRGGLTFGWDWGEFTMAKDFINIGSSYQSPVILSSKAPSFPFIRLDVHPVKWCRYNFIHAWLNSDLIDSASIRSTGVTSTLLDRSLSYSKIQKYYLGHSVSIQPIDNWWLTFGESIIYSDQLEYIYFLPVFFRLADHYNSMSGGDSGDNAQIFFNTSYRWEQIKSKFYLSLYIDELSPESFFSGGDNAQVYAATFGSKFTNPFWNDSYLTLEYTAIKPYSYLNGDPAQTYFSSGYQLGNWIGSNAIQVYAMFEQYISQSLKFETQYQLIKKGSQENINDYYNRVTSTYPLLSGEQSTYSELGIKLSYNPYNDLYFILDYRNVFNADGRFINEYNLKKGSSFSTLINYGF
ncbi:MAG TPA: hypothetical protein PLH53_07585 [Ignavibacteriaceae bacterium]|nr:hypothetical protein [Ignavibacteriaceae bacterium]